MPAYALQSSNVFSYTFAGAANTHFNYVQIANTAANPILNLGGQSWTAECWLKPQNRGINGTYGAIFSKRRGGGGTNGTDISYMAYLSNTNAFLSYYDGTERISSSRLTPNTWNHVAWVFNQGSNVRIFLNGTNVFSVGVTSVANIESSFFVGLNPGENSQYFGDISNLRIIRGQAIYSGDFQISTQPFQLPNNAIGPHAGATNVAASLTGNVILLTCNDGNRLSVDGNSTSILSGNTFINGFVYPHQVDPLEVTEYSYNNLPQKFGDQTNSRSFIVSTDSTNLNVPSGDFTLECWAYIVSGSGTLVNKGGGINIAWPSFLITHNFGNVYFAGSNTNARMDIGGDGANGVGGNVHRGYIGTFAKNTWNHVAVTRSGTTYYGFLNGVLGYTETTANTPYNSTGRGLTILGYVENASNTWSAGVSYQDIAGHISNLRLVTGRALYTSNFTPPQAPLAFIPGTQLLTAKTSTLTDLAGSVTLAANGMGSIEATIFNPFTSNTVLGSSLSGPASNANSSMGFSSNYSIGLKSKVNNKFNYQNFGQMVNIYAALAQRLGRIRDKFDYTNFGQMINIYATLGQRQTRIRDKFDVEKFAFTLPSSVYTLGQKQRQISDKFDCGKFAFSTPVNIYTVGQKSGRTYTKQLLQSDWAYFAFGSTANNTVSANIEYQFWS